MSEQERPSWGCTHGTASYLICTSCIREAAEEEIQREMIEVLKALHLLLNQVTHPRMVVHDAT